MGVLRSGLIVLAILSPVALAEPPTEESIKEEMKKLQGTWQIIQFIDSSEKPAPADEIKDLSFEFRGNRLVRSDRKTVEMKYTLNPQKKPAWIDVDMGFPIGTVEGIYALQGDELKICLIAGAKCGKFAPRPSEFKASETKLYSLFVLKRVKK